MRKNLILALLVALQIWMAAFLNALAFGSDETVEIVLLTVPAAMMLGALVFGFVTLTRIVREA
jgi:hypothetical protein